MRCAESVTSWIEVLHIDVAMFKNEPSATAAVSQHIPASVSADATNGVSSFI